MLRTVLHRLFPYVLAVAWIAATGYTVASAASLSEVHHQRATGAPTGCDCA